MNLELPDSPQQRLHGSHTQLPSNEAIPLLLYLLVIQHPSDMNQVLWAFNVYSFHPCNFLNHVTNSKFQKLYFQCIISICLVCVNFIRNQVSFVRYTPLSPYFVCIQMLLFFLNLQRHLSTFSSTVRQLLISLSKYMRSITNKKVFFLTRFPRLYSP